MFWLIVIAICTYFAYKFLYGPEPASEGDDVARDTTSRVVHDTILPTLPPPDPTPKSIHSAREQIQKTVESLNWCNDIMRLSWPFIGKIVEAQLGPTVEPAINLALPRPFKNFKFIRSSLGKDPLKVDRVTVHRRYENSIALDLDVSFVGHPDIQMKVGGLSSFGIKELRWTGRLSVLMRPLVTTIPLIGAVQAAFVTHPNLEIDFSGVADVLDVGPIERVVHKVMRDVLAQMLVLPNRFLYKMSDTINFFDVYYPPIGAMVVTVVEGRGFIVQKKMKFVKDVIDAYVKVKFGLEKFQTPVQNNNLTPKWNTSHTFILSDFEQPLEMKVMDKDKTNRDDIVGISTIIAEDLLNNPSKWIPLQREVDVKCAANAEILLKTELLAYKDPLEPVTGLCMATVLVDRAQKLPKGTKSASCNVFIGKQEIRSTVAVVEPVEPIVGVDPENPIWSAGFDTLCADPSAADVVLEVVEGKKVLGRVAFNAAEVASLDTKSKEGVFPIGGGATVRAKVILRGLVKDATPLKS